MIYLMYSIVNYYCNIIVMKNQMLLIVLVVIGNIILQLL